MTQPRTVRRARRFCMLGAWMALVGSACGAPRVQAAVAPGATGQTQTAAAPSVLERPPVDGGQGAIALDSGPAEILSDTQGVNFQPYLRHLLGSIYDQWLRLLPPEAKPPQKLSGETTIRFAILPNGTLESMHLDGSTHNDRLNRAAWGAITGAGADGFAPLPAAFHGQHLELRVHFKVNKAAE